MICSAEFDSPVGKLILAAEEDALVGVWFEGQRFFGAGLEFAPGDNEVLRQTKDWLARYFAGERPESGELPLRPQGSPFRQAVWKELLRIPYGQTVCYGDIVRALSRDGIGACAQAVGGAVGHNPISIIIPCHRVVGADGSLTGYAGGVEKKRALLEMESGKVNVIQ